MDKVKNKKILETQGLILKMEQMRGVKPPSQPWQGYICYHHATTIILGLTKKFNVKKEFISLI